MYEHFCLFFVCFFFGFKKQVAQSCALLKSCLELALHSLRRSRSNPSTMQFVVWALNMATR